MRIKSIDSMMNLRSNPIDMMGFGNAPTNTPQPAIDEARPLGRGYALVHFNDELYGNHAGIGDSETPFGMIDPGTTEGLAKPGQYVPDMPVPAPYDGAAGGTAPAPTSPTASAPVMPFGGGTAPPAALPEQAPPGGAQVNPPAAATPGGTTVQGGAGNSPAAHQPAPASGQNPSGAAADGLGGLAPLLSVLSGLTKPLVGLLGSLIQNAGAHSGGGGSTAGGGGSGEGIRMGGGGGNNASAQHANTPQADETSHTAPEQALPSEPGPTAEVADGPGAGADAGGGGGDGA